MQTCKHHPACADVCEMPDGTLLCDACFNNREPIDETGENFGLECDECGDFPLFSEMPKPVATNVNAA